MHGCHAWSINSGPFKPALAVTVRQGAVLKITNNDVMPHKLVQTSGPQVRLIHPNMSTMASVTTLRLTHKGVYRFTTKPGEDYQVGRLDEDDRRGQRAAPDHPRQVSSLSARVRGRSGQGAAP